MNYDFDKIRKEFTNKYGYEPSQNELMEYINNSTTNSSTANNGGGNGILILFSIWFICFFI